MKIYLGIILVLLAVCVFLGVEWQREKNTREDRDRTIIALSGQKTALEKEIEKRNKNVIELQKRNKELEELAKQDDYDWNTDISDTSVILYLKERLH